MTGSGPGPQSVGGPAFAAARCYSDVTIHGVDGFFRLSCFVNRVRFSRVVWLSLRC